MVQAFLWYGISSAIQLLFFVLMLVKGFGLTPVSWGWIVTAWAGVFAGRFMAAIHEVE